MIDKKSFRVTNEEAKLIITTSVHFMDEVTGITTDELAADLLDARELIDKQKALIKEMRRTIYTLYMECEMYEVEINLCKDILEKTKEYI